MSEEFGPTFITVTDEDGQEIVLEFIDALEYNGQMYQAFFPAETEGEEEDPSAPTSRISFGELQFGRDYEIT